jgi:2-amino-4-hydroxy-6-hydroxymethyldihydropteridine diphosphokinase
VTRALLSVGSNLGDRYAHLRGAVAGLADSVLLVSGVDESVTADGWLARAQALEAASGRVRDPQRRFGPRTLDVDVIMVWTEDGLPVLSEAPHLTLPHPRVHERAFVLRPWLDIQPYAQIPGRGWVTDLMLAPAVAADLPALTPRPDLSLEP